MKTVLQKKSIIQKTVQVGCSTLMSRILGIVREYLLVKYLGVGAVSDAFLTAFKIPNSLRKIFAEGALSAAFVPTFVQIMHKDKKEHAHQLMSLSFLFFEGIVLGLCALVIWKTGAVLGFIAPGFSAQQIGYAVPYLRILMPFIFFISSSALLAGALQAEHHFFIPAISPVLLNVVFIASLLLCIAYQWTVPYLCILILLGGCAQFLLHLAAYYRLRFSFGSIDWHTWKLFKTILAKFIPCTVAMSVMELSLFIDTSFASYLPSGSISLLHYANRFMGVPLGVFAVALSTILLPHFSRLAAYAPKRMSFYLLESAKLVLWVTLPITFIMSFVADKIFLTLFLSDTFTYARVHEARNILIAFLVGLFFFSLNKIIVNVYYARHNTIIPTIIALASTLINIGLNVIFMQWWRSTGLALATSLSVGCVQTIFLLCGVSLIFGFRVYIGSFMIFSMRYMFQLTLILACMAAVYSMMVMLVGMLPLLLSQFMLNGMGYWIWFMPLAIITMLTLFYTRRLFGIRMHFLG